MMKWKELLSSRRLGEKNEVKDSSEVRSAFEADYDRIIFSRPFRNLQDKTQVFPLPDQDFVHTRLTHSLEVSSVARSLGKSVGQRLIQKYPELQSFSPSDFGAITGAAALAHDVGNPPFGHSGETAISDYFKFNQNAKKIKELLSVQEWADLTHFEGNAQGFRLLTRNQRQGLKLTMATLAAFTKYPCPSHFEERDKSKKSQKKYGYFQSEKALFEELAGELGLLNAGGHEPVYSRHPLAFLVEAADDICYSIIDLEDGFGLGLTTFDQARDFLANILEDKYQPEKLTKIPSDKEKIGVLRAVAINQLIGQCTEAFMKYEEEILVGHFDKALTDLIPASPVLEGISSFSIKNIYQSRQVLEKEVVGFEVISGLLDSFVNAVYRRQYEKERYSGLEKSVYRLLPEDLVYKIENEANTIYETIILVTDFISAMTDSSALKLYRIIKGIELK